MMSNDLGGGAGKGGGTGGSIRSQFCYNDQCVTMWAGNEKYWVSVLYTTLHYMDLHFQKDRQDGDSGEKS